MRLHAALLGLALLVAVPACAQTSPATATEEKLTALSLSETAQRDLPRNRLRAELRAEASGSDARRVQAEINQRMAAALDRAKAVASVKAETGNYSLYEDRQPNAKARWHGQQTLILTGEAFPELLELAGELQQNGLVFSNLSFELKPETARAAEDALTEEALKRLRERAERIARAMNLSIVRFRTVHVGNVLGDRPRPVMMARMEMSAAAKPAPAPVAEAGEQAVQVTVDAEILLGPGQRP